MWKKYYTPINLNQALTILDDEKEKCYIIAGGTDILLEIKRKVKETPYSLLDISRINEGMKDIREEDGIIHIGGSVTHGDCLGSELLWYHARPLVQACTEVGSPQIRNRGTISGNLATASPANDTITPLMALQTQLTLNSLHGERVVPLNDFYLGVRKTVIAPNEIITKISFPSMKEDQVGKFAKFGLRKSLAIAVVNLCVILTLDNNQVKDSVFTLGSVAPTVIRAEFPSDFLKGKTLNPEVINRTAELVVESSHPINDIRGSADYRRELLRVLTRRILLELSNGHRSEISKDKKVRLQTDHFIEKPPITPIPAIHEEGNLIITKINGFKYVFRNHPGTTLLDLLRSSGKFVGTKDGCSEGECGACTIILDGQAVNSCLVPAPRAHQSEIVTIEGLNNNNQLHPIQQNFIDEGAVQCGYCTPGFIMSGAVLMEELPQANRDQIIEGLSGNLCRCTGYYKIITAVEKAIQEDRNG